MKIVFASNYYNHHQKPLADALFRQTNGQYTFIATQPMSEERKNMGWGQEEVPSYVKYNYLDEQSKAECQRLIDEADVVILGNAPYTMIKTRLKKGKLTFFYTERLYKDGIPILRMPLNFAISLRRYLLYKNFYVLCASAYTAADFSKTLAFIHKTYQWVSDYDNCLKVRTAPCLVEVCKALVCECLKLLLATDKGSSRIWSVTEIVRKRLLEHSPACISSCSSLLEDDSSLCVNLLWVTCHEV